MRMKLSRITSFCAVLAFVAQATAADGLADCQSPAATKSRSKQVFDGSTLMVSLLTLEKQGEANFRPLFPEPADACVRERFEVAGITVSAAYAGVQKGEQQTLLYRFTTGGDDVREILVLFDAMASLMAKKGIIFTVVENRAGNISYYAMFRDEPAYATVKKLVSGILDGSEKPLATVRWPVGAKEPVIDAYDAKRLK